MISWLLSTRLGRILSAATLAVLAFVGIIVAARQDAAQDATREIEHEYEQETSRRIEAGHTAVRRDPGGSADERVLRNDDKWN